MNFVECSEKLCDEVAEIFQKTVFVHISSDDDGQWLDRDVVFPFREFFLTNKTTGRILTLGILDKFSEIEYFIKM